METTEKTSEKTAESTTKTETGQHPDSPRMLKKKTTWERITISMLGIVILVGIWQWAVWHLYSLPAEAVSSFTTITVNSFYAITAVVIFFVTGKMIYDAKVDTVSHVVTEGRALFEKHEKKVEITERIIDETAKNENLREYQE